MKILALDCTCGACPHQFEGTLDDGRMIYIRYRGGWLVASVSADPTTDIYDAVDGEELFAEKIGGHYDGVLPKYALKHWLEFHKIGIGPLVKCDF